MSRSSCPAGAVKDIVDSIPPVSELGVAIGRSKGLLLSREAAQHAVDLLAQAVKAALPAALGAGVSLMQAGQRTSIGSTDDLVRRADDLQYALGEGPCLTSWATAEAVRLEDTTTSTRWARWNAAAAEAGIRSSLSVPVIGGSGPLGAMKVYSAVPAAFDARDQALLMRLATAAGTLLGHIQTPDTPRLISAELRRVMRARDVLGLATGILMERYGLSEDQAHLRLLESARAQGVKAADLAASIAGPEDSPTIGGGAGTEGH